MVTALARLMPKISGMGMAKRRLLYGVTQSIIYVRGPNLGGGNGNRPVQENVSVHSEEGSPEGGKCVQDGVCRGGAGGDGSGAHRLKVKERGGLFCSEEGRRDRVRETERTMAEWQTRSVVEARTQGDKFPWSVPDRARGA